MLPPLLPPQAHNPTANPKRIRVRCSKALRFLGENLTPTVPASRATNRALTAHPSSRTLG